MSSVFCHAQWTNTTNEFYDSLAMMVTTATGDQYYPIVLKSFPDSGYFVIWEEGLIGQIKILAQKYDKDGNQLWNTNGVAVATSTLPIFYRAFDYNAAISGNDWRNYSFAATDSANGFYIAYEVGGNSDKLRVMAQHIRDDGSSVFPNDGFTVYYDANSNRTGFAYPQLIPDGNKGFFVGFQVGGDLSVLCYRDENGTMKYYGGGIVSYNAEEYKSDCGRTLVGIVHAASVSDYILYPNLQKGCGITMSLYIQPDKNTLGGRYYLTGFNELVRVKKDVDQAVTFPENQTIHYPKDSVMVLFQVKSRAEDLPCTDGTGIATNYFLISNGFLTLNEPQQNETFVRGAILSTDGNINVNVMAAIERNKIPDALTAYYYPREKYDDIPYPYKVSPYFIPSSLAGNAPPGQDKLNWSRDTIVYTKTAIHDFAMAGSGNKIFVAAFTDSLGSGFHNIIIQQLKLDRESSDSFSVKNNTSNRFGINAANDFNGYPQASINTSPPQIAVDHSGHALLYYYEFGHYIRISPIGEGGNLEWGPAGKPMGNPFYDNSNFTVPYVALSPADGTGVIAWYGYGTSTKYPKDDDIMIRHLDSLNIPNYFPPMGRIKLLPASNRYSANPQILNGVTGKWTFFNYNNNNPLVALKDMSPLGGVKVSVYQQLGDTRQYNGQPYLNRNYTIVPQHQPASPQPIRIYFTNNDMDALKAADPTITGPEMLQIVKQPSLTPDAPGAFVPSTEEIVNPSSWAAVDGGYYLEFSVTGFSNFFIQKINGPLPLQWIEVNAHWTSNNTMAIISWQVANQVNVKSYHVQESSDGVHFENVCEVEASNSNFYHCSIPASDKSFHYYRVEETDADGRTSLSRVVILNPVLQDEVTLFPNPADKLLHLNGLRGLNDIIIYTMEGKVLKRIRISQAAFEIDVSHLKPGYYMVEIRSDRADCKLPFVRI